MNLSQYAYLEDACASLPVLLTLNGIDVRWIGPLVEHPRHASGVGAMSDAGWGHLASSSGWEEHLEDAGALYDENGEVRDAFATAFAEAARELAEAGSMEGPESNVELWAAWLGFELSATHDTLKRLAAETPEEE